MRAPERGWGPPGKQKIGIPLDAATAVAGSVIGGLDLGLASSAATYCRAEPVGLLALAGPASSRLLAVAEITAIGAHEESKPDRA